MGQNRTAAARMLMAGVVAWSLVSSGIPGVDHITHAQPHAGDSLPPPAPDTLLGCSSSCYVPASNPYTDPCQCVHYAWKRAAQAGHKLPRWGDGHCWDDGALGCGYTVSDRPNPGSVAVWGPGQAGAWPPGHVGWVDDVSGNQFHVWHMNWGGPYCTATQGWFDVQEGITFIWLDTTPTPTLTPTITPTPTPTTPPPPFTPTAFGYLPLVMK